MNKILYKLLLAMGFLLACTNTFAERSGEQVYQSVCVGCHMPGVAGAPKPGDSKAWNARYGGDIEKLLVGAKKGINVMPPKGSCSNCSDEELKAAIIHMLK